MITFFVNGTVRFYLYNSMHPSNRLDPASSYQLHTAALGKQFFYQTQIQLPIRDDHINLIDIGIANKGFSGKFGGIGQQEDIGCSVRHNLVYPGSKYICRHNVVRIKIYTVCTEETFPEGDCSQDLFRQMPAEILPMITKQPTDQIYVTVFGKYGQVLQRIGIDLYVPQFLPVQAFHQ